MLVLFKENYECVIKDTAAIRLGDTLCELLNSDIVYLQLLEKRVVSILKRIDLTSEENKEIYNGRVSGYTDLLTEQMKLIESCKSEMQILPYYKYSKDVEKAFNILSAFVVDILSQLKHRSPDMDILDAQLSYDAKMFEKAFKTITLLISTTYKCSIFFRSMVDKCLLYDPSNSNEKPIQRLMKYGLDKFNSEANKAIKYAGTTEASSLSLFYEIVEDNGNLSLLQCFEFVTLPQFVYHEFMKMVSLNLSVQKCKNCGEYFVIFGERILEYCGNIPKGQSKPCSVIGPAKLYGQKVKNDPILEIYTRAYKKYVARKRSGIISADEFKSWTVKARELRDRAYKENTSTEVFTEWMQ